MASKYNTVTETVTAEQLLFDTMKDLYMWLNYTDTTFSIKNKALSAVITGSNGEKLSVQKNDYVVKDSAGNISVWKEADFKKKFIKA